MSRAQWIQIDGPSPAHVLSYTSAKILIQKSPLHAWLRKRRELEEDEDDDTEERDAGTIVHAMLLGVQTRKIVVLPFKDFRTKAAKEARDEALAAGHIVVKEHRERWYSAQATRIRRTLENMGIELAGHAEAGIQWSELADDGDEVVCRGSVDLWQPGTRTILDLKIVRTAHPESIRKQVYSMAYDIQAAAYTSAIEGLDPRLEGRTRFVFVFCELASGACTPVELAGDFAALGRMRWRRAVNTWARCLREDRWPGYVETTTTIGAPEWAMADEMTRQHDTAAETWGAVQGQQEPAGEDAGEEQNDHDDDVF